MKFIAQVEINISLKKKFELVVEEAWLSKEEMETDLGWSKFLCFLHVFGLPDRTLSCVCILADLSKDPRGRGYRCVPEEPSRSRAPELL